MAFTLFKKKTPAAMGSPAANDAVRAQLRKMGDDGAQIRHVLHYAYPARGTDLAARPAMIAELTARGFEVSDAAAEGGLVMEHYRSVVADDFDALTQDLHDWFAARGWGYDGWECALAPPGAQTVH